MSDSTRESWLLRIAPSAKDPVTPVTALGALILFGLGTILLRAAADTIAPWLFLGAALTAAPVADWLEGKRRMAAATIAATLATIGVAATWNLTGWLLLPPAFLVWWLPWAIGHGRGSRKSNRKKVDHGLALIREGLTPIVAAHAPPGTRIRPPKIEGTSVKMRLKFPSSTPRGSAPVHADPAKSTQTLASKIANDLGRRVGEVDVVDLSRTDEAGAAMVTIRAAAEFAAALKPRPPATEWPAGKVPIGEYAHGNVAYLSRHHVVIGAETGAGKSWLLENIIHGHLSIGTACILIDPKVVAFAKYRHCLSVARYASKPAEMLAALQQAIAAMDARYQILVAKGREEWTRDDGPFMLVVVDETADLLGLCPEAEGPLVRLYQKARAAGIQLVTATQRPDANSIPPLVKANAGTVIGLRVANPTAERVMWEDAARRGINIANRSLPPGRAFMDTPGQDGAWIQVYPTPGADGLPMAPQPPQPAQPPDSCPPYAGPMWVSPVSETPGHETRETSRPTFEDQPNLDALGVRLYAGKDTRTIILEALDEHPETREALALLTGTSVQNVGKHLATLVAQGLAAKVQGGWIRLNQGG